MKLRALILAALCAVFFNTAAAAGQSISVGGTTNLAPLVSKAAIAYQSGHGGITVAVNGTSSGAGIAALKGRAVDVAMSDVAVNDPDFADTILGTVGFAFIVAPDVTIKNLSHDEAVAIFSGKVTNWKQIGGVDRAIAIVGRDIGTGTRFVMEAKVAKTLVPFTIEPNADAVLATVASTPGAIGYVATGFIGTHQSMVISYDGVTPSEANIRDHSYAFATDEHLYTRKNANATVMDFVNYVKGDAALLRANGVY
jgi:phosphate transport system substrate-binding protein